ncbi:subunit TOM40 of mitochondrial import receptor [Chloropicon roscoffensis]|uniref:Subunit TOM40 of mitochondrial import receptor n=1 Tax=Chloropicon roscoffensis TaxID=1461544 RepID=A0AAX4PKL0_9CHLO
MTGLSQQGQGAFGTYASSVLFRKQRGGEGPAHRGAYVVSLAQEAKESSLVIPSVAEDAAPAADGAGQETEAPAAQAQTDFASAVLSKETDFLELPQPVRYEELQKECLMSLRPETFEGMRFDFTKPLNQSFSLSHSLQMGSAEMPTANPQQIVKVPVSSYEFGANLIGAKGMMIGRMLTDGRMSGRVKYDVNDSVSFKVQAQLAEEKQYSQTMFDCDVKGLDWNAQLKVGNNQFVGVNYFQSVTNNLALGGEAFYLGSQRKSGVGFALRHQGEPGIATCQVATTGLLSATYHHKVSDKVYLASEMMWNWNAREATAAFGYDYILRQCRLRGRIDSSGVITAFLEERLNVGVNFVLSAELDHYRKDYRFGFGMTVGME